MVISEKGLALIKQFESLRLATYKDSVGIPTIGWGHTGPEVKMGQKITQEEAVRLLRADVARFEKAVGRVVRVVLNQNQFDALVSFSFNVGAQALEDSTLLKKLNAGDVQGAADQFPRWNKAGGEVLAGLTRRRAAERSLFLS